MHQPPFILPYAGVAPAIGALLAGAGDRAAVLGRATIGAGAILGAGSTIRADGHEVRIGRDFVLGARGLVHIAHDLHPSLVGDGVAAGADAVIHACTIGDGCVIGDGCIVLDGSVIAAGSVLMPGTVVFPRTMLEGDTVYSGAPARAQGPADPALRDRLRAGIAAAAQADRLDPAEGEVPGIFVARTARIAGPVEAGQDASIFFGCDLVGTGGRIRIGARTNVQDNSRLTARAADLDIGADTTIGHNVVMEDCRVAPASLIGIGSRLAPGTEVEGDVLLAAGAVTTPGQRLGSGMLWGGNPARPIAEMTEARRRVVSGTIAQYCAYAAAFRAAQDTAAQQGRAG